MRGDTAVGHVDAHNELRAGVLREAERFGVTVDIGGPYKVGDPGHIQEHNKTRAALDLLATTAGVKVVLPDEHRVGDTGHAPHDHDLLDQALAVISKADAWNDATGGTITDYTKADKTRWRVHTFTESGALVVKRAARPFRVLVVGGGGTGGTGCPNGSGGGGGGGGVWGNDAFTLTATTYPFIVGSGGPATSADIMTSPSGSPSTAFGKTAGGGGGGGTGAWSGKKPAGGGGGGGAGTDGANGGAGGDGSNDSARSGAGSPGSTNKSVSSDITGTLTNYGSGGPSAAGNMPAPKTPGFGYGGEGHDPSGGPAGNAGYSGVVIVSYQIGVSA